MLFPDGYILEDFILYGEFDTRGHVSKIFRIEVDECRNAGNGHWNAMVEQLGNFFSYFRLPKRIQFYFTTDSDYSRELKQYDDTTEQVARNPWTYKTRKDRFNRSWELMKRGYLVRSYLYFSISMPIEDSPPLFLKREGLAEWYKKQSRAYAAAFQSDLHAIERTLNGFAKITPLSQVETFKTILMYLNPSYSQKFTFNPEILFDPSQSIHQNCLRNGVAIAPLKTADYGFILDGYYYDTFVIKQFPENSSPGKFLSLTETGMLDYSITVNIEPISIQAEIAKEDARINRLEGDAAGEKKFSLRKQIEKAQDKVSSLSAGFTYPFNVTYIIVVRGKTLEELSAKISSIKVAIRETQMKTWKESIEKGAGFTSHLSLFQVALPVSSIKLFAQAMPGWIFGKYSKHKVYCEQNTLADMLPFTSTFTGHLSGAEAIYDGDRFNVVGVKNFLNGQPQLATMIGGTGAGKSATMCDLLAQTECFYDYTVIIEDGRSYQCYARIMGTDSIIIQPDGELTINPFDTGGLPLTSMHLSGTSGLLSRMCGALSSEAEQRLRNANLVRYLERFYEFTYRNWVKANPKKLNDAAKMAILVERYRKLHNVPTVIDTWIEVKDLLREGVKEITDLQKLITEQEISEYIVSSKKQYLLRSMSFSFYDRKEYPTLTQFVNYMSANAQPEHRQEIFNICRLLETWNAWGKYGKLFDGTTNVSLTDRLVIFELGAIPESAMEMKDIAGYLITEFTRNHIMILPKKWRKRYIFEEVSKFIPIAGGETILKECYAQMRKHGTWVISITQQYNQLIEKSPALATIIMGNASQHFFLRQDSREDLDHMGDSIALPYSARTAIHQYPKPAMLPAAQRYASVMYVHQDVKPVCGTMQIVTTPLVLFSALPPDKDSKQLRKIDDMRIAEQKKKEANPDYTEKNIVEIVETILKSS